MAHDSHVNNVFLRISYTLVSMLSNVDEDPVIGRPQDTRVRLL